MKKLLLSSAFVFMALVGVFVIAQTITGSFVVNAINCSESDGGLNYNTYGTVSGSFWWPTGSGTNGTYTGTFTDVCLSSTTLLEGVCGSSINANYSNVAGAVYVDCSRPNPAFGCVNGACRLVGNNTNSTNSSNRADLIVSNLVYTYVANGSIIINTNTTNSTNGTSTNGTTILTTYRVFVNATVRNSGNAVAGASTTLLMDNTVVLGISSVNVATPSLGVGQSASVSGVVSGVTGINNIQAAADYLNVVVESNEYNNGMMVSATLP